jgi:hypothetical protein
VSSRSDVLLWARRITGMKKTTPHQLLEIAPDAGLDVAQEAFHKIARMAHPDLHRRTLLPEELELVTTAYARAAAAYQELRGLRSTTRPRPIRDDATAPAAPTTAVIPTSPPANKAVAVAGTDEPAGPAPRMSSKALVHYRKAELALRRGELTGAVLHLKMAIASDPQSAFLRSALAEVEAEVTKKP